MSDVSKCMLIYEDYNNRERYIYQAGWDDAKVTHSGSS